MYSKKNMKGGISLGEVGFVFFFLFYINPPKFSSKIIFKKKKTFNFGTCLFRALFLGSPHDGKVTIL